MTIEFGARFIANLRMLPTEEGGRKTAIRVGGKIYRPQFCLDSDSTTTTLFVDKVEGRETILPGETLEIECSLLKPELFEGRLRAGTKFKLCEGPTVVGRGIVKKMLCE